jgi:hypothetical protein
VLKYNQSNNYFHINRYEFINDIETGNMNNTIYNTKHIININDINIEKELDINYIKYIG